VNDLTPEQELERQIAEGKARLADAKRAQKSRGKYANVTPHLPKLQEPRNDRVNAAREQYRNQSAVNLARVYADLRRAKDEIEDTLSSINVRIEAVASLLVTAYEEEGVTSLKIAETGQSVSVQSEPIAAFEGTTAEERAAAKEKFRLWCLANGFERQMALHPQTTQALVKQLLLDGQPEPDGIKAYTLDKLVLRQR
jgi:hypothetical protein